MNLTKNILISRREAWKASICRTSAQFAEKAAAIAAIDAQLAELG